MGPGWHALHEIAPRAVHRVDRFLDAGGIVMGPLMLLCFAMWYLIALRALELRRGIARNHFEHVLTMPRAKAQAQRGILAQAAYEIRQGPRIPTGASSSHIELVLRRCQAVLDRNARAIQTLVAAAPLLGLLGTVIGMIETFQSLGEMAMYAESGGIAAGISEALITTETGLGIAIPGLLVERLLQQKATAIGRDLQHLGAMAHRYLNARTQEAT